MRLNMVGCYQQVLHLSDILDASGNTIDSKYIKGCQQGDTWSTLIFTQESPPHRNSKLWEEAIHHIAPKGRPRHRLGRFLHSGHKIWEYRYDVENAKLYRLKGSLMDVYTSAANRGHT
jgi:hypothetical protein